MSAVLHFKSICYFDDDMERTIEGAQFRALMELCFAQADTFSLLRSGWPGAQDGALEQALRPWLVGEYASYGILHWFDRQSRETCYLYRANRETKEILLQHIHHLFEAEQSLAPAGHQAYLEEKYAVYDRASEEAWDRFSAYMEAEGQEQSEKQQNAVLLGLYKKAREGCPDIFSERDHYSNMEDPCFFRGNEMFFETITHEQECWAQVLNPEFEAALRKLGEWLDVSGDTSLPLFSLAAAEGMNQKRDLFADGTCHSCLLPEFFEHSCEKGRKEAVMKPNIEKTRAYYRNLGPENICSCDDCRNYCAKVKGAYPEVARYLDSLGVDIEKPFETSPLETDEDGYLEYCVCQYIVFGTCPPDYAHQIGDVKFGISDCHPDTKLDEEHFVLDLYPIRLKFEPPEPIS